MVTKSYLKPTYHPTFVTKVTVVIVVTVVSAATVRMKKVVIKKNLDVFCCWT